MIRLASPLALSGIMLWNGYQRSQTHYAANARPSKLKIGINGADEFVLGPQDKSGAQRLAFPRTYSEVTELKLTIEGVYPGRSYKDVVISELKLLDTQGRIVVLQTPAAGRSGSAGWVRAPAGHLAGTVPAGFRSGRRDELL